MPNTSPNMNLPIPIIGVDTGLTWEQAVAAALTIIDGHNHSSGSGVPIIPAGININTGLPFNDNDATLLRSARFQVQPSAISNPDDLGCLYVTGADLFFNDESGNQIQITSGGTVNATSSGITSGNSSASFVSTVLQVYSDNTTSPPTPGNVSCQSVLLGLNSASSNRLTLSPPASLAGGPFTLTLPGIPGASQFVTLDNAGNFGASVPVAGGIVASNIAAGTITTSQIASSTIKQSNMAILRPTSSGFVTATTSSTSYVSSGLAVTITTTGGAVVLMCVGSATLTGPSGPEEMDYEWRRTGTSSATFAVGTIIEGFGQTYYRSATAFNCVDTSVGSAAGTYTYTLFYKANSGTTVGIAGASVTAFEL